MKNIVIKLLFLVFYTLEEKQVGELVDGSPVYQKIIRIPDSTNINNCFSLGITTLNTIIN